MYDYQYKCQTQSEIMNNECITWHILYLQLAENLRLNETSRKSETEWILAKTVTH